MEDDDLTKITKLATSNGRLQGVKEMYLIAEQYYPDGHELLDILRKHMGQVLKEETA